APRHEVSLPAASRLGGFAAEQAHSPISTPVPTQSLLRGCLRVVILLRDRGSTTSHARNRWRCSIRRSLMIFSAALRSCFSAASTAQCALFARSAAGRCLFAK